MEIDVQHIAKLAKLSIPDDKVESFTAEMRDILAMVENLPPMAQDGNLLEPGNLMQLRVDKNRPSFPREKILQNAPKQAQGCFLAPKTVE